MAEKKKTRIEMDKDFTESLVELCPDAIIGVNRQGVVTIFNKAAEILTGRTADNVINQLHVSKLYDPPELAREVKKRIYSSDQGGAGKMKNMEVRIKTREDKSVPIMLSAALINKNNEEIGSIGFFHDLTRTKQLEEISISDELTGLYNRYHFRSVLAKELDRCIRYNRPLTIAYIDLDNFKPFNDSFGHAQGDDILRLVGSCAKQLLRIQDTAFRLGGDEFALLLVETDLESGAIVADRFRHAFNEQWFKVMSHVGKGLNAVSLSIGLAQYCREDKAGSRRENTDNLIKRADIAMYEAKRAGGNKVVKAGEFIGKDCM